MKKLIVLSLLLLCGCGRNIYPEDIEKAQEICKDLGGLYRIEPNIEPTAVCKVRDGKKHKYIR